MPSSSFEGSFHNCNCSNLHSTYNNRCPWRNCFRASLMFRRRRCSLVCTGQHRNCRCSSHCCPCSLLGCPKYSWCLAMASSMMLDNTQSFHPSRTQSALCNQTSYSNSHSHWDHTPSHGQCQQPRPGRTQRSTSPCPAWSLSFRSTSKKVCLIQIQINLFN